MAGWWKGGEVVFQAAQHHRSAPRAQAAQCDPSCGHRLVQVLSRDMIRRRPHGSNNVSGSREEFHLPAPTDPYVSLSTYTALVTLITRRREPTSNAQTYGDTSR